MPESPFEAKRAFRARMREQLRTLHDPERDALSSQACSLLTRQPAWENARTVMLYAPMRDELDLWPLLQAALLDDKVVALPRFDPLTGHYGAGQVKIPDEDVHSGQFGIREPLPRCAAVELNKLDFLVVPGVAFDAHGRRLGRGKGFYDRILAAARGLACGAAFDFQIVAELPTESHDAAVNCILTPTRWLGL